MLRVWWSLLKGGSAGWSVVGDPPGPGKGGSDPDKNKDKEQSEKKNNEPFEGFKFDRNRFRSSRGEDGNYTFDLNDLFRSSGAFGGGKSASGDQEFPQIKLRKPGKGGFIAMIVGAVMVVLLLALPALASFWTDSIWFNEVGQSNVFWTRFWSQIIIFGAAFIFAFCLIMLNVAIARKIGPKGPTINPADNPLAAVIGGSVKLLNWGFIGGAVVLSLMLAGAANSAWPVVLQFFNAAPWPETERILNQSIGFYVFELPFYSFLQGWLIGLLVISLAAAALVYALNFALNGQRFDLTFGIKAHISVLGAALLGLFAWGYQISNNRLPFSQRGVVPGANATDIEAQLPANNILTVLVALAAVALLANIFIRNRRTGIGLLFGAVAIWLVSTVLVGNVYPSLTQNVSVRPNEITKETPYIENTIAQTRKAFGLDQIQVVQFGGTAQLTAQEIANNQSIQNNVRLWDYPKIQTVYDQKETLRRYYDFKDVDIDRYSLDLNNSGQPQKTQVMISARELSIDKLDPRSQTWQSKHLQYTHGYGVQASPVNQADAQGYPVNLITQSFPLSSSGPLKVDQPRIYYGQGFGGTSDYAIVGTKLEEVDYPFTTGGSEEGRSATYSYTGKGGIKLDNFFVKAAFALRLGDFNLMVSDALDADSKLLWNRNIQERAREIAPFLLFDRDPYMVIADGRLQFIQDAYTYTNLYPHSDPVGRLSRDPSLTGLPDLNYIRNSVKIVTDAYDGTMSFYMVETGGADPIVKTYANIYPGLFKPLSEMPESLKPHLRYPEGLFRIQGAVYQTYHVTDPTTYYNKQDQWQLPTDPRVEQNGRLLEPSYLLTELPGERNTEFVLIQPFVPQGKNNLVSWMAARSDGENYGKLVAYNFQSSVNVYGPGQFYSAVNADQEFSRSRTLLNSTGSSLQPGPLLIIPVDKSVLYVLPYYLIGTGNPIPSLEFVAVSANNRVIVRPTLQEALTQVLTSGTAVNPNPNPATGNANPPATGTTTPNAGATPNPNPAVTAPPASSQPGTVADLRRSIAGHLERAIAANQAGDKAAADQALTLAQQELQQLNRLLGQ